MITMLIVFNKKILLSLVFVAILFTPSSVSAQQNLQSGGSLQSGSNNTQNTRTLQTPSNPNQGGNSAFLGTPKASLDVVGNPSQTNPSVSVGASTSKTDVTDQEVTKDSNFWPVFFITIALLAVFFFAYRYFSGGRIEQTENIEIEIKPGAIGPKIQSKKAVAKKNTETKKSSNKNSRKKKKKRSHR